MANLNYDPDTRYDTGPNAAGCGRTTSPVRTTHQDLVLATPFTVPGGGPLSPATTVTTEGGLQIDQTVYNSEIRSGFSCAGHSRINHGPNVAGAPRSVNNT